MPDLEYQVKLRSSLDLTDMVKFVVTPDLSENRTVNYKSVDPIHAPGQIFAFVNSSSRTFQLSGVKLISRTQEEAQNNLEILWKLREWTMPVFGKDPLSGTNQRNNRTALDIQRKTVEGSSQAGDVLSARRKLLQNGKSESEAFGTDLRGAPPQVLLLTAYSHDGHYDSSMAHINRVPVVITSLSIPYPSDCDYFPTTSGVPMPTVMSIDIALSETHSPKEYEKFDLSKFKKGILPGF